MALPLARPFLQMVQLDPQNCRLQGIETAVDSQQLVLVSFPAAVNPQNTQAIARSGSCV